MSQRVLVEQFGAVRPHQAGAFNFHLQEQLKHFDIEYAKNNGRLGSLQHQRDRYEFAKLVSESVINAFINDSGQIAELKTKTEFRCQSLQRTFVIKTSSTFNRGATNDTLDFSLN